MNSTDIALKRKQKVSILHYASPPVVGGVEITINHHARILLELGYQVGIVTGRGEPFLPDAKFFLIPELNTRNERVQKTGEELAYGRVGKKFLKLRDYIVEQLKPILEEYEVCIVHNAMSLHLNLALTAALKILNDNRVTNFIAWNHDFAWHDKLYIPDLHEGYPWELLRLPWSGVKYVVVSEHRKGRLAKLLNISEEDIEVVTPGVDVFDFLQLQPLTKKLIIKLDLLNSYPLMLLPARIIFRKNIQYALEATVVLRKDFPQVGLVVTGPPGPHNPKNLEYLNSLRSLCNENNLDKNVHFLYEKGDDAQPLYIPDKVMADFFRLSDLLIFPPFREGFGIPILEAGLVKLPVFASDIPSIRESGVNLINVFDPFGNPSEVAKEIQDYLKNNRELQLKRRVIDQFSWRSIIEKRIIPIMEGVSIN